MEIPESLRLFLNEMHKDQIKKLSSLYGEYFKKWEYQTFRDDKDSFKPYIVIER
jgi:hypothetical protein